MNKVSVPLHPTLARPPVGSDETSGLIARAHTARVAAGRRADELDRDGAFPTEDIRLLHRLGLLHAPFAAEQGGDSLGIGRPRLLRVVLGILGEGSLALGRLYEGHVNAVALVTRHGTVTNLDLMLQEAEAGRPSGVWMAGEPLKLVRGVDRRLTLQGHKVLCSGAGHFRRPLVAADYEGGSVMVIPNVGGDRADISGWTSHGMRATATGTVDFTGIEVGQDEIIGCPGDYLRSPYFRGGAWRVIAVQLGGIEAVLRHYKRQLIDSPHRDHPIQLARFGQAAIAAETARLWVRQASEIAENPDGDPAAIDAYVDLARNAFERAALEVVALAQKAIGLKTFLRPNPMERIIRDLTTYLRQPALDMSLGSAASFLLATSEERSD
jgi:alkylation response protein AidB-like acyl-CoA dehydrogenase